MATIVTTFADEQEDLGKTYVVEPPVWLRPDLLDDALPSTIGSTASPSELKDRPESTVSEQASLPIDVLPPPQPPHRKIRSGAKIELIQQWECIITDIDGDVVECEMYDLTDESQPVEFAELLIDEFNEYDHALLKPGCVFYWSVGYKRNERALGTIERYSRLLVRRVPRLSRAREKELKDKADRLHEILNGSD